MSWDGILIGGAAFLLIGVFHPVVIKAEYHFGKGIWPLFLLLGMLLLGLSLFLCQPVPSAILGVAGFSSLWSIRELYEQEERVAKGWFPKKPPLHTTLSNQGGIIMEMRRKNLAVTEPEKIDQIIQSCDCIRLAFGDEGFPYIVPVNFGFTHQDGVRKFYFHGATSGRKIDLARKLGRAGFELDRDHLLHPNEKACDFSMRYQCVIGGGRVDEITGLAEKKDALEILMTQLTGRGDWEIPESVLKHTCVFCLTVEEISAKEHG